MERPCRWLGALVLFVSGLAVTLCLSFLLGASGIAEVEGRPGVGGTEQDWGYVTVRQHAHMFWWLYYTTANVSNYTERPLIIWLQGGPGMPSSGYGNFAEIGPFNATLHPRTDSAVNSYNILFVDNPVGVGFSYVSDNSTKLVSNGDEIGEDLYNFLLGFLELHAEFRTVPLYVFGESYGGKMATDFVHNLKQKEAKTGAKICNLKGLGLGDAYISPMDYIHHLAPMALHLGLVDKHGFTRIDELAKQMEVLIGKEEFENAADFENNITDELWERLSIDIYNFLERGNASTLPKFMDDMPVLREVMNDEVARVLNISTEESKWDYFKYDLHESLKSDLITSVTHKIEALLNNTDVKVIVYSGILDFLVNTAGTISWLENLNWSGKMWWGVQDITPLMIDDIYEGYSKRVGNLVFYAVLRAGHSVPVDNMAAFNRILEQELS